jgi:hypothetical protein
MFDQLGFRQMIEFTPPHTPTRLFCTAHEKPKRSPPSAHQLVPILEPMADQ